MKYLEALNEIKNTDKEIERTSGRGYGKGFIVHMVGSIPTTKYHQKLDIYDMNANDWVIVPEKEPSLSDKIVGWKCQVDDIQETVKDIKGRIEDIIVLNHNMGRMKILVQRIINEGMGDKIVLTKMQEHLKENFENAG